IQRVVIFRLARTAHSEWRHRRVRTVIGNIAHNREPRPAVRAVDKWIPVTAVLSVEQVQGTVRGSRYILRKQRADGVAALTGDYTEFAIGIACYFDGPQLGDSRQRRCLFGKTTDKFLDRIQRPLHFNGDARWRVGDVPTEMPFNRQAIDIGPKTDS